MASLHWFIPNRKNKYHPNILRPIGLSAVLLVAFAITPVYNIVEAGKFQVLGYATSISVGDLHTLSNQERTQAGLKAYSLNSKLNNAAYAKAQDMFADDYWAHTAPDGTQPWHFISAAGYSYVAAGENLAKDFNTSSGVVSAWMNSSGHRANIMSSTYKDVGYAVVNGNLSGEDTTLVVAMYAAPQSAPAQPQITPDSPSTEKTPAENTAPAPKKKPPAKKEKAKEEEKTEQTQPVPASPSNIPPSGSSTDKGYILGSVSPAEVYDSYNWGQKATIFVLSSLMLLHIMKHTLVWRQQRRGYRHIWLRSHPLGQAFVLGAVLVVTVFSSVGVIQ